MKKTFWLAFAAVLATSALAAGGTLALFSASRSTSADYTAGKLCLTSERNDGDPVPGPMFYVTAAQGSTPSGQPGTYPTGEWAPGDMHQRTLTVFNPLSCSTMDAWVDTVQASIHAGGYTPMADKLWVEVLTPQNGIEKKVAEGWLSQFVSGPIQVLYPDGSRVPLNLSSNRHMKFKVSFDLLADNSYQGKTLVVDFTVNGVQKANNP